METERLYIHRVEPVRRNGKVTLEPVPENPQQENLGVKYRLAILKKDGKNATCYGWDTGYRGGGFDEVTYPEAEIYAPNGFMKGNTVFVNAIDKMLGISTRDMSSIDRFLESLNESDIEEVIKEFQGFSFAGL